MSEPIIGMRFGVLFLGGGVTPNPLDVRFQKVYALVGKIQEQAARQIEADNASKAEAAPAPGETRKTLNEATSPGG